MPAPLRERGSFFPLTLLASPVTTRAIRRPTSSCQAPGSSHPDRLLWGSITEVSLTLVALLAVVLFTIVANRAIGVN